MISVLEEMGLSKDEIIESIMATLNIDRAWAESIYMIEKGELGGDVVVAGEDGSEFAPEVDVLG